MKRILYSQGLILLAVFFILAGTIAITLGGDSRVNTITHLGGLVVYCADANRQPSDDYEDGGLKVLYYKDGQVSEVFFVSAEAIDRLGDAPTTNVIIGTWDGPNGTITLYRLTSGEFQINGYDEHGKPFAFSWSECADEGIPAQSSGGSGSFPSNPPIATNTPRPI
ncbi:MAG: hypothetical protein K8L97_31630 [Anaerolineae bacterium]|nr:hypothetical protein [Anaerolineae bacterium]